MSMFLEPNIQMLGANLRAYLDRAKESMVNDSYVPGGDPGRNGSEGG
jgi:hypothetical protein